ncbi:MAG: tRNA glutamyl-Q(34) synthetase GluQRS [Gammaproteobacteria bacterium]|nr:tRNA glutamyl-Q(34) synthetase GluQRS [Gammaproteobacteria bacterium]
MLPKDQPTQLYRGRFAPSPSGDLHFGSLIAAVGSYLEAKRHHGEWLLRIEDLDPPRVVTGASSAILKTLEQHHLYWDHPVLYQSKQTKQYHQALKQLATSGLLFGCHCTRNQLKEHRLYPGNCINAALSLDYHAVRIQAETMTLSTRDPWQGVQRWPLKQAVGDFIIRRADGVYSYQLAVVVDDYLQKITHVVRGSDLLDSTPRQIYLQQKLDYPPPLYSHLPVAGGRNGNKLSKQNLAKPLNSATAPQNIFQALQFLGQHPPQDLERSSLTTLWQWAEENWKADHVPHQPMITVEFR